MSLPHSSIDRVGVVSVAILNSGVLAPLSFATVNAPVSRLSGLLVLVFLRPLLSSPTSNRFWTRVLMPVA